MADDRLANSMRDVIAKCATQGYDPVAVSVWIGESWSSYIRLIRRSSRRFSSSWDVWVHSLAVFGDQDYAYTIMRSCLRSG